MNPHQRCLLAIPLLALLARSTPALADDAQPNARPTTLNNATEPAPRRHLAWTLGVVDVGSAGQNGGALSVGLRFRPMRYFETSVEFGYGLLDGARGPEDRWWAIPAIALVIPVGRTAFDLGGGLGSGTVSGYPTWPSYFAHPFEPRWHITEPAVRGHLGFSVPLKGPTELWLRGDVGTILAPAPVSDTMWYGLTVGVQGWVASVDQPSQAPSTPVTDQTPDSASANFVKNKASKPLWITGTTLALLPYAGFITSGIFCGLGGCWGAALGSGDWSVYKDLMPSGYSFIPLAGPFIDVGIAASGRQGSPTRMVFYSMAGGAEIAGVTMAIVGAALPKKRLAIPSRLSSPPSVGISSNGIFVYGVL